MTLVNQNYFVNEGKPTSRVSQAPGGRSSVNLGWGKLEGASLDTEIQFPIVVIIHESKLL